MLRNRLLRGALVGFFLSGFSLSLVAAETIQYDSGKRRDPFVPPNVAAGTSTTTASSGFKLEGIIYDPDGQSMAILDGKPYAMGDLVGGGKIVGIRKDHVIVVVAGEEKVLWIRTEEAT